MLDGHSALKHAKEATGDNAIEEVAIAFPPGTTRTQASGIGAGDVAGGLLGAAAAGASGIGSGVVAGGGIGALAANLALDHSEPYASVVLALSPKALYLLGRHKVGPLASFADLTVIAQLPREEVQAHLAQAGIVKDLTIVDTKTGEEHVYEVKPLGSGVTALLDDLDKDA